MTPEVAELVEEEEEVSINTNPKITILKKTAMNFQAEVEAHLEVPEAAKNLGEDSAVVLEKPYVFLIL